MSEQQQSLAIPVAIVIAGVLIAGAVFFGSKGGDTPNVVRAPQGETPPAQVGSPANMRTVSNADHIRGNPNAPVKIVEYSDTECPFCKKFHTTMLQIMSEYGKSGQVAWVYRHFPLDQLHSKARSEATAFECAAELGGNEKFWAYTDRLFEITPSNNRLETTELPKIAEYVGLDVNKFNSCLVSGKYVKHIEDDAQNATATGGRGTPWSIVVTKNGDKTPLDGAQPYESVKQMIETALQENN